jgi:ubiquinone/menaquinone biosynthesis C-methylase UbiE
VVVGLLSKDNDGCFNTPATELLTGNPEEMPAAFIPWQLQVVGRPMAWFYESLKANTNIGLQREIAGTSPTLYGRLADDPPRERLFHNMMGSVTRLVAEDLIEAADFSKFTHMLDIGGGTAVNATYFAQRWPDLQITIADLPTIVDTANVKIESLGLSDRVRAVGLDAFRDEFPAGCDCVLFAHFLEIWSVDSNRALLAKASRAVTAGAGIFVVTQGQDDQTESQQAAALSAYFLTVASGKGMVYSLEDYRIGSRRPVSS